ncbi:MAG: LysR family transcriptional regulator [Gammaproteobacteria bacterium]|nr:LysR family transcriptional regulator [Gammaproteobacteria bacterium]
MDLRQMRYFLALAEERNFTRAAARLHIAQPPLTRQIRALEQALGSVLFLRTPKGVELTEAGHALLDEVPNLLALAQRARDRAQLAGQGRTGRLDVGIFGSGIFDVIPRLLARFHAERPDVRIVLHNHTKAEQIEALRERRIAIGFNRLVPAENDLVVETVLREKLVVALPENHRLARRRKLALADLDDEPMILYPKQPMAGLAQRVIQAFTLDDVRLRIEQEVEDVLTGIALVVGGFGFCITTESSTNLRLPGVAYRPLDCEHLRDIELACLYRKGDTSPVLAAFLEIVRGSPKRRARKISGTRHLIRESRQ